MRGLFVAMILLVSVSAQAFGPIIITSGVTPVVVPTWTDNFNRANEDPIASPWNAVWAAQDLLGRLLDNGVATDNNTDLGGGYNKYTGALTCANDQSATVTLMNWTGDRDTAGPAVRISADGLSAYFVLAQRYGPTIYWRLHEIPGWGTLVSGTETFSSGDTIKLDATGSTLTVYKNGVSIGSATDTTIASGVPGFVSDHDGHTTDIPYVDSITLTGCQ